MSETRDIVERLDARYTSRKSGAVETWPHPDPLCREAANAIRALLKALEEIGTPDQTAPWYVEALVAPLRQRAREALAEAGGEP